VRLQTHGEFEARGNIQKVEIAIPWAKLTRSPLRIKISGASLVIDARPGVASESTSKKVPTKQHQLLADELFRRQWHRLLRDGAVAAGKKRSFGARVIKSLLGRLSDNGELQTRLKLTSYIVRYLS
jgi:hypothetical protein